MIRFGVSFLISHFIPISHLFLLSKTLSSGLKEMAEEHRCQAPKLCANNCGLFGSPATQNLCSKCHSDLQLKQHQSSSAHHALNQAPIPSSSASSSTLSSPDEEWAETKEAIKVAETEEVEVRPKRCLSCKKRVGITGFKCRCGMVFCGIHRYPEEHGCDFDFKAMGKRQIAIANPVVKAVKLHKI